MTQDYVSSRKVLAWEQAQEGNPGFMVKETAGDIHWVDRETFEAQHLALGNIGHLPEHVQRIVIEKVQLKTRLDALLGFLAKIDAGTSPVAVSVVEVQFMHQQAEAMSKYHEALTERLRLGKQRTFKAVGIEMKNTTINLFSFLPEGSADFSDSIGGVRFLDIKTKEGYQVKFSLDTSLPIDGAVRATNYRLTIGDTHFGASLDSERGVFSISGGVDVELTLDLEVILVNHNHVEV